jgi:glycosyltransferase involved in cell wall biosynthesis
MGTAVRMLSADTREPTGQDVSRPLSIAIISKSTAVGGGASRIAEDLAKMLVTRDDLVVHHWYGYSGGPWMPHMRNLYGSRIPNRLHKACRKVSQCIGMPDFFTPELLYLWKRGALDYDIYHFHDTSTTFSPIAMRWLARHKPVVWTFHDCSPFTGGCLYPMGCTAFHKRCGKCPQLDRWPLNTAIDFTGLMQSYKRETAREGLLVPIAPSNWMADEAMKSGMFAERPIVIPYSVDVDRFRPLDKLATRRMLGLREDRFTVLVSAYNLFDERKGVKHAIAALKAFGASAQVVLVGAPDPSLLSAGIGEEVRVTGYIGDPNQLAKYYAAADVFLFPTLADNLPNSILETMASGTPTIAFRTGGVPDMIDHGTNGWLVEPGDEAGLAEGLRFALANPATLSKWAIECRTRAEQRYGQSTFVEAHLDLYRDVLAGRAQTKRCRRKCA